MCDVIDARSIVVEGVECILTIVADDDERPWFADCYTPEDVKGWHRGDWRYVGVILGIAHDEDIPNASLWAVEYGTLAGQHITVDDIINREEGTCNGVPFTLVESLFAEIEAGFNS